MEVEVLHQQGEAQGGEERGEDGVAATRWREREKWGVLGLGAPPPLWPTNGPAHLDGLRWAGSPRSSSPTNNLKF